MGRRAVVAGLALLTVLTASGCSTGDLRDVPMPRLVSGRTYEVTAVFGNVLGLPEQAPVKMQGATIGEVTHITTEHFQARVAMDISAAYRMPVDIRAEIRFASPMGEAFIELTEPDTPARTVIAPGGVIPIESTSQAPSVSDLLSATSAVVTGGSFADMKVIVTELNAALRGNGGNIRTLLAQLDGMTARLNAHTVQFDRALDSLDTLGRGMAKDRDLLARSIEAIQPAVRALYAERTRILDLMASFRKLSATGTSTLRATRTDMRSVLADLGPILDTLTAHQKDFVEIVQGIHDFSHATDSALYGLFLNFDLTTIVDDKTLTSTLGGLPRQQGGGR